MIVDMIVGSLLFQECIFSLNQTPCDEIPAGARLEISLLGFCKLRRHAILYEGR